MATDGWCRRNAATAFVGEAGAERPPLNAISYRFSPRIQRKRLSPLVLGFGGTILPDVPAAVLGLAATLVFYKWLHARDYLGVVAVGALTALAVLAKSTWMILPLIFLLLLNVRMVASAVSESENSADRDRGRTVIRIVRCSLHCCGKSCVLVLSFLFVVAAGYNFDGLMVPLKEYQFVSHALSGSAEPGSDLTVGNRFAIAWVGSCPIPLPEHLLKGIDEQWMQFESRKSSYFLGTTQRGGWWYYYVVGFFIKEPAASWVLVGLGISLCVFRRSIALSGWRWTLFVPGLIALSLVSWQHDFCRHLRYALPAYPAIYLATGAVVLMCKHVVGKAVIGLLMALYVFESIAVVPYSHSFASSLVGGPANTWRYMDGSNVEWGEGLLPMIHWARSHPERRPIHVVAPHSEAMLRRLFDDVHTGKLQNPEPHHVHSRQSTGYEKTQIDTWRMFDSRHPDGVVGDDASTDSAAEALAPGWWMVSTSEFVRPKWAFFSRLRAFESPTPTLRIYEILHSLDQ